MIGTPNRGMTGQVYRRTTVIERGDQGKRPRGSLGGGTELTSTYTCNFKLTPPPNTKTRPALCHDRLLPSKQLLVIIPSH